MEYGITENKHFRVIENMLRNCPLNMVYYNLIFTDEEVVVDYLIKSYRTWILHVKPVKEYKYDGVSTADILKKSSENFSIKYKDIEKIVFKERSFFTNARIEITAKCLEEKLVLFNKNRIGLKAYYDLVKPYLNERAEIK